MPDKVPLLPFALAEHESILPYLSIGMVTAYLRVHRGGALAEHYDIARVRPGGLPGFPLEDLYRGVPGEGPAICLLSSYVWNHRHNLAAAHAIKARNPNALVVIGGPEVPKYPGETEAFLEQQPAIDVAVLGEGEVTCAELLDTLAANGGDAGSLETVAGIVYRAGNSLSRTADRDRARDINRFPSPYLTGEFEPWFEAFTNTILETNRGCPYGCTYCDWGSATLEKVTRFDPVRVIAEIEYLAERRSEAIFIADANFGMLEQDIPIAEALVQIKARTGYPQRIYTNFAKNGGRRLMAVIKILHEGGLLPTGIVALQTTDEDVLKTIRRDNIRTASYEKMMAYFNAENIPMASDLMVGLPGQTVDSVQRDLQFCFDWKVSAHANYTSMMPNAPMAEPAYREEHQIVTDRKGMVASTASFSVQDMQYMKRLYAVYQFHVRLGVMKYSLYYLQLDHGVPALGLLRRWLDAVLAGDPRLPLGRRVFEDIFALEQRSGDWALMSWGDEAGFLFEHPERYHREFHGFAAQEFDLQLQDSELAALSGAQAAVMPRSERQYPFVVELDHNVAAYVKQLKAAPSTRELADSHRPLGRFPAGRLRVPRGRQGDPLQFRQIDGHRDGWELRSPLRFW